MASNLAPAGRYYRATVPDTLDLAERAALALNAVLGNLEPSKSYGVYQSFMFDRTVQRGGLTWNLPAKNARAMPWLRTMTGSHAGLDVEEGLIRTLVAQIRGDGLAYVPIDNDGAPRGTAYPFANGLLALAAYNWFERDGDASWLDLTRRVCSGLRSIAMAAEDRAYYPPESSYTPDAGWVWTLRGEAKIPYRPPDEPTCEQQGLEGCVKYEQAAPMRALVAEFVRDRDEQTRELVERLCRFMTKPGLWEDTSADGYEGYEHGVFAGHVHGNLTALHALLEYAVATGDASLGQIVREGYEHCRRTGVARMGWIPGWLRPERHHRDPRMFLASESCGVSDLLLLAVKLSDAGLGDYWDDVDAIVRNHLVAQQFDDLDAMRRLAGNDPRHEADLRRFHGGFGQSMEGWVNSSAPRIFGCCTANGAIGLYYAWHGITRFAGGTAVVNLFLNRASAWIDIDSYLPYEGRVVLHNKLARRVLVRIPAWVDVAALRVSVNGKPMDADRLGNVVCVPDLARHDVLELKFPLRDSEASSTIGDRVYDIRYRGSTVVDITPRSTDDQLYQYYLRTQLLAGTAPMRDVERFEAARVLPLQ